MEMGAGGSRSGRRAATLSPQRTVGASLGLPEREGTGRFTFRALGARPGAGPTAVYRHFRDKDDLLLAVADELLARALDAFEPSADRQGTLHSPFPRMREVHPAHPRTAAPATVRTTRRPAGMRAVGIIPGAPAEAGFGPGRAAYHCRALVGFAPSWSCRRNVTHAAPDARTRAGDASFRGHEYALASAHRHPRLAAAAPCLPKAEGPDDGHFALAPDPTPEAVAARAGAAGGRTSD
ncbi:TetR family transcriptional regulator [Streptomyces sp. F-3]|nr:TetR family transcriptional regulator [Streptomyces sp. F-3]